MKTTILGWLIVGVFCTNAWAGSFTVPVIQTEKVFESRNIQTPHKECHNVTYQERVPSQSQNTETNSLGIDTLLGAAVGVAAGSAFHNHTSAAQLGGAVVGSLFANKIVRPHNNNGGYQTRTTVRKECSTVYTNTTEKVLVGYNCTAYLGDRVITKFSPHLLQYINIEY